MNDSFFLWYYTRGLSGAPFVLWNYLRYTLHRFNILGLLGTLVSPWKRDVTPRTWRGWHPLKSLNRLVENLLSRFLGMLVRLGVIVFGITVFLLVLFGGTLLLFGYALAPLFLVTGLITLGADILWGAGLLLLGIAGIAFGFFGYQAREREEPADFSLASLRHSRSFPRILARLGLKKGFFDEGILENDERFMEFLQSLGISRLTFERSVLIERHREQEERLRARFWSWDRLEKAPRLGRTWKFGYTPKLDRYVTDLSQGDFSEYAHAELVGRTDELKVAGVILERPTENSLILVGDPGIGKQTFIHYFARLIRENAFRGTFFDDSRVLLFDFGRAVGDATTQGSDPENFLRYLLSEAVMAGNIILVIENVDLFMGGEETGRHNFAPLLGEFLIYPGFRVIGTASASAYHALMKHDEHSLKYFEAVYMRETDADETLGILIDEFKEVEKKQIVFTMKGFEQIVENADRYNWETPFPERALDLAHEVLTYWRTTDESFITEATVDAFIALKTGIPQGAVGEEEKDKLLRLEELLHERVVGQDTAVTRVAEAMRKARAGFGNEKRPLGSFLFLGPTGVGKTETAKAFAESYFGSEDRMIRLDMSEFQTAESIDRLIGSQEKGLTGELTNALQENPFSLLLLDEIEKAYPQALDLFLQILDEGYVNDGFGKKVSFRSAVIIATSNAGAPLLKQLIEAGTPQEEIEKRMIDEVVNRGIFRLEFLNRFDGVVFFSPLQEQELLEVVGLKLRDLQARLKKEKNIALQFGEGVPEAIVAKGYRPEFGARSLNRFINDTIEDRVAKAIISGELANGGTLTLTPNDL